MAHRNVRAFHSEVFFFEIQSPFIILFLILFSVSSIAEEAQKASEMAMPLSEQPNKAAQKRAYKNEKKISPPRR
jgi:hypothetical protein